MPNDARSKVAVVGATGAVGREALAILAKRGFPAERVLALASPRSAGTRLPYGNGMVEVAVLTHARLHQAAAALFCASAEVAQQFAPGLLETGGHVVDNSSCFRLVEGVPLVIPECNGELLATKPRLVANPNCSTILLLSALEPLRAARGIEHITVTTYQAVSGAGLEAIAELQQQMAAKVRGETPQAHFFPELCTGNVFVHESPMDPTTGMNGEESKIIAESRKVWGNSGLRVFPTCARVPVERAHTQSIVVDLATPIGLEELRSVYARAKELELVDDWVGGHFPTPLAASGGDRVQVGRLRLDPDAAGRRVALWACADQLRKGAALNAVQILSRLVDQRQ